MVVFVLVLVVVEKEVTDIVMFRNFLDVARNLRSTVTAKTCQLGSRWFEVTHEGYSVLGKQRLSNTSDTHIIIIIHLHSSKSQLHKRPQNARHHDLAHAGLIASEQQGQLSSSLAQFSSEFPWMVFGCVGANEDDEGEWESTEESRSLWRGHVLDVCTLLSPPACAPQAPSSARAS
jgi:hypothetical protein